MTISRDDSPFSGPVTIAFLLQRNVAIEWHEVVAIVLEIADVLERSGRSVLPTYQDIALRPDGSIRFLTGDHDRSGNSLAALVDICRALLPTDSPARIWALVSVTGPDAPVYESTRDFAASLRSVERGSRRDTLAHLYRRALEAPPPAVRLGSDGADTAASLPVRMLRTEEIQSHEAPDGTVPEPVVASVRRHGLLPPILVRETRTGFELVAGSKWLAAAKAANLTRLPCQVCDVDDEEARVLLELDGFEAEEAGRARSAPPPDWSMVSGPTLGEVADSLEVARSCWGLSAEGAGRPYQRTVSEVTRVELQRATWIVEGLRVLGERPVLEKRSHNIGALLDRVFQATQPERRLSSIRLLANLSEASLVVSGDERLLLMAYGGTLQAMLTLVDQVRPAVVRCEVMVRDSDAVVELSQDVVALPHPLLERFFDESYHGRPGGYGAAVALSAAKRVMELHGGSVAITPIEPRGCRLVTRLPL